MSRDMDVCLRAFFAVNVTADANNNNNFAPQL